MPGGPTANLEDRVERLLDRASELHRENDRLRLEMQKKDQQIEVLQGRLDRLERSRSDASAQVQALLQEIEGLGLPVEEAP